MKKRLISMLLTVLMVASLVGGMSVSAYADSTYQTINYTVKSGDTLLQICNNNGLNWYTCEAAIDKLNNLSSSNYRYLSVGSVIKLPASNEDAAKVVAAATTTTTTVTTTTNGVSNTVTTTSTSSGSAASSASYWLISYTMQKGETVSGVCNTLGINFDTYSSLIKSVNGISSWSKVSAGKTIYLPTTTAPVSGTSCYAVMSHTIAKGETATSICKSYGTSYSTVQKLISGLNPNSNMNSLKAGATLLVPVPTVVTSTTTSSTATSSGSTIVAGTNTGTNTSGTTTTGTGSTGSTTKTYKLSTGTVTDGSISFTVNGKTATSAAAGAKVHINVTPGSYKALSSLTLTRADGSKATTISDGEFTMPESNVTVSATFADGRYIGTSSDGGSVLLTLNGVQVSHAVKGAKVQVNVTPKDGYEISGISIVNTATGATVAGDVKNGGTFTMPDATVMVKVTYKTSATYKLTKNIVNLNGSYTLKSGGTEISSAIAGTKVLIDAEPADGYEVGTITVIADNSNGKKVTVTNNYFTMPTDDVTVTVPFTKITDAEKFDITVASSVNGWATALTEDGDSSATAETTINVELTPVAGFQPVKFTVKANGSTKTYDYSEVQSFEMPSGDVVVTPYFEPYKATVTDITTNDSTIGNIVVSTNGKQLASRAAGGAVELTADNGNEVAVQANLTVTVTMKKSGYTVDSILLKSDGNEDIKLTSGTAITVPASLAEKKVTVDVQYKANSVKLGDSKTDSNVSYVSVNRGTADNIGKAVNVGDSISTGEKLHIYAEGKTGYDVKIYAVYKDANGKEQKQEITYNDGYDITVPACSSFYVKVVSSAAERKITVKNDWPDVIKIQIGSGKEQVVPVGSNDYTVKTGDKVIIKSFGTGGAFDLETSDSDLTVTNSGNKQYTFTMPAIEADKTITVTLSDLA